MPRTEHIKEIDASIRISEQIALPGTLTLPAACAGTVIFAHGSGSSRLSPRNVAVADSLVARGCATLLFDLLTESEATNRENVFDISLLAQRVVAACRWVQACDGVNSRPIGCFGASTGAAAALVASGQLRDQIAAVVSRGGRPDLAGEALPHVAAPTLLLVGSRDLPVIEMNREAQQMMRCHTRLSIIEGASHLFEEPGTLEEVARQAGDWFVAKFDSAGTAEQ